MFERLQDLDKRDVVSGHRLKGNANSFALSLRVSIIRAENFKLAPVGIPSGAVLANPHKGSFSKPKKTRHRGPPLLVQHILKKKE